MGLQRALKNQFFFRKICDTIASCFAFWNGSHRPSTVGSDQMPSQPDPESVRETRKTNVLKVSSLCCRLRRPSGEGLAREQPAPPAHSLHQHPAARAREGVPLQQVPVSSSSHRNRSVARPHRETGACVCVCVCEMVWKGVRAWCPPETN